MDGREFSCLRHQLGKSQSQLARLLGVSAKAVQSFEQGWRNVPPQAERQLLFLVQLKSSPGSHQPCWEVKQCPTRDREHCPAWELQAGTLCWFVNGTMCQGIVQDSWKRKMELCRSCEVFSELVHTEGLRRHAATLGGGP